MGGMWPQWGLIHLVQYSHLILSDESLCINMTQKIKQDICSPIVPKGMVKRFNGESQKMSSWCWLQKDSSEA